MVALDFPPCQSAGVQRTLHFKSYIERNGWHPLVLTSKPFIYDKVNVDQLKQQEYFNADIYRAFGLNAFKHLSFRGKHFEFTTFPDKYATWFWDAVRVGRKVISQRKPDIIWSTFPCSTSVRIGLSLKKSSGLPWVADFRDPFSGTNPYVRAKNPLGKIIDEEGVKHADALIFTTKNAADVYLKEYAFIDKEKIHIIPNGFSEKAFDQLGAHGEKKVNVVSKDVVTVLHSGFLYPGGRDISTLVDALIDLKVEAPELFRKFRFVFRGSVIPEGIQQTLINSGLEDKVIFLPTISFSESLKEMFEADVLLVLQGEMFNNQIPGKVYEYIRAKRLILALTHRSGATAELLGAVPHACTADMEIKIEIKKALKTLSAQEVSADFDPSPYNRDVGAKLLDGVLNKVLSQFTRGKVS